MRPTNILEVRGLRVWFPVKKGIFGRIAGHVKAVDGVSFELRRGETLGLVGESGSGKSTVARAILGLNRPKDGEIVFNGADRRNWSDLEYHRKVQVVFQDPLSSLNPRHTILEALTEGLVYHKLCRHEERRARALALLESVGLSGAALDRFPHEFSGGERQRICIARAMALEPELLICDEAVSALDLSIRAQILDLLQGLKARHGLSLLFITHDIGVVQHIADRVLVMHKGRIVESGFCSEVLKAPKEAYTRALIAAVPKIGKVLV